MAIIIQNSNHYLFNTKRLRFMQKFKMAAMHQYTFRWYKSVLFHSKFNDVIPIYWLIMTILNGICIFFSKHGTIIYSTENQDGGHRLLYTRGSKQQIYYILCIVEDAWLFFAMKVHSLYFIFLHQSKPSDVTRFGIFKMCAIPQSVKSQISWCNLYIMAKYGHNYTTDDIFMYLDIWCVHSQNH